MDLTSSIQKAFDFHSWGFNAPYVFDGWVMGPTFIVKANELVEQQAFNALSGIYIQDDNWNVKFTSILAGAPKATKELTLSKDKHDASPKCTYRVFVETLNEQYPLELGFPLTQLAKKVGVTRFTTVDDGIDVLVFGWAQDKLVAAFTGRRCVEGHIK